MAKELVKTVLSVSTPYTSVGSVYATAQQYIEPSDNFLQYPQYVWEIKFYKLTTEGMKIVHCITAHDLVKSQPWYFVFQMPVMKKLVIHRDEKAIKSNECFSFKEHTLFLNADKLGIEGPYYSKVALREDLDAKRINFGLKTKIYWPNGNHKQILTYDQLDYLRLVTKFIENNNLKEGMFGLVSVDEARGYSTAWNNLANELECKLTWWQQATTKEIVEWYNDYLRSIGDTAHIIEEVKEENEYE